MSGGKITALQDVQIAGKWFTRDTEFAVADTAKPEAKPPVIDRTTAEVWKKRGWAKPSEATARSSSKAD